MANPSPVGVHANVLLAGTAEINRWANENPGQSLDLRHAYISNSELSGASLRTANLSEATFQNCKLVGVEFDNAILANTQFIDCDLRKSRVRFTDVTTTSLKNSILDESDFAGTRGTSQIRGIETCRVIDRLTDVHFDISLCRQLDRFVSWGKIRALGQLRLFLPSYVALLISIMTLTSLSFFNERLAIVRDLVADLINRGIVSGETGDRIIEALHSWQFSWRHLAVLASTLGLALGATLYLACPSRVKEFTLDQWKYLAGRPSFEYHVQTWALPHVRAWCAICYALGALIAATLLGDTFVRAVALIIRGLIS